MTLQKTTVAALALTLAAATPAVAAEVDAGQVVTFQANTPAVAAEVNATIGALIAAIDDNASMLAALDLRVQLLEATAGSRSVNGETYRFAELATSINGVEGQTPTLAIGALNNGGTITFGDGTGAGSIDGFVYEIQSDVPSSDGMNPFGVADQSGNEVTNFTYTQTNAQVNVATPEGSIQFFVSPDGHTLIAMAFTEEPGEQGGEVRLIIGVRE